MTNVESDIDPEFDPELALEFNKVRDTVYERLRQATDVPRGRHFRVGQLLVLSAFDNPHSWDIVQPSEGELTLYQTCWRFDLDVVAFETRQDRNKYPSPFVPTLEVKSVPLDTHQLRHLLDEFRQINIPLSLTDWEKWGQDGVSYELLLGDSWANCRLHWWNELPKEWRVLKPIIKKMVETFEAAAG